jgi:hypothetical protein
MGTEGPSLNDLDGGGGVARASVKLTAECFEIARAVGKLCGYPEPVDWPPKWSQSHYRVQTWLNGGWSRENIIAACHRDDGRQARRSAQQHQLFRQADRELPPKEDTTGPPGEDAA